MLLKHKKSLVNVNSTENGKEVATEWEQRPTEAKWLAKPDKVSRVLGAPASLGVSWEPLPSIRAGEASSAF